MTTTEDPSIPTPRERREMITLIAADGFKSIGNDPEIIEAVLQALCIEVLDLGIRVDQELEPAVKLVGAMVGGLFGAGEQLHPLLAPKVSGEDDDEDRAWQGFITAMFEQGKRVRYHIARQIGWPRPGRTLADDDVEALERMDEREVEREAVRAVQARNQQLLAKLEASVGKRQA